MATAPKPGVGKRKEAAVAAQSMLNITYAGEQYTLAWQNVPMGERLAVRKATGMPLEALTNQLSATGVNQIGEDSLCVLWWLMRRAAGELTLDFDEALATWDVTKVDDLTVTVDDDAKGDDPEG